MWVVLLARFESANRGSEFIRESCRSNAENALNVLAYSRINSLPHFTSLLALQYLYRTNHASPHASR